MLTCVWACDYTWTHCTHYYADVHKMLVIKHHLHFHALSGLAEEVEGNVTGKTTSWFDVNK